MKTAELRIHITFLPPLVSRSLFSYPPALAKNQHVVFILTRKLKPQKLFFNSKTIALCLVPKGVQSTGMAVFQNFATPTTKTKSTPNREVKSYSTEMIKLGATMQSFVYKDFSSRHALRLEVNQMWAFYSALHTLVDLFASNTHAHT